MLLICLHLAATILHQKRENESGGVCMEMIVIEVLYMMTNVEKQQKITTEQLVTVLR